MNSLMLQRALRVCSVRRLPFMIAIAHSSRRFCSSGSHGGHNSLKGAEGTPIASNAPLQDLLDMDESMTINVCRLSKEQDSALHVATRTYLHTLITTTDEQEWKDMLVAAIRLDTWREHHLRSVLRSVHQSQYDVDTVEGRHGKIKSNCTPSTRLQRALGVVQTAVEEGYRVTPESVHALLVILLRAAGADITASSGAAGEPTPQSQLTNSAAVWQFLSWMERNDYHVMSDAVLQSLEKIIEENVGDRSAGEHHMSVSQNRLDYLRREHRLLRQDCPSSLSERRGARGVPVRRETDTGCE